MKEIKLALVAGARPNFIKIAPIIKALKKYNFLEKNFFKNLYPFDSFRDIKLVPLRDFYFPEIKFNYTLIHTGQHYDENMSGTFFKLLDIPKPHVNFGVGGKSDLTQISLMLENFESFFERNSFDLVLLVGDVNSTLAASISASRFNLKIAHVEAGLRSFDKGMPEEINRVVTDSISDLFFISEISGYENLVKEGKNVSRLFFCGNVMIDSLLSNFEKIKKGNFFNKINLKKKGYVVLTLHRPSNVDNGKRFREILRGILDSKIPYPIIYPIHPRSRKNINKFGLEKFFSGKVENGKIFLLDPLGYIDFLNLVYFSRFVLSDSGGIQEETSFLNIPCITLRENTERPVTIESGTNILAGTNYEGIKRAIAGVLKNPKKMSNPIPLWDGKSSFRIVKHLAEFFGEK